MQRNLRQPLTSRGMNLTNRQYGALEVREQRERVQPPLYSSLEKENIDPTGRIQRVEPLITTTPVSEEVPVMPQAPRRRARQGAFSF